MRAVLGLVVAGLLAAAALDGLRAQDQPDADAIAKALRPFIPRAPGIEVEDEWRQPQISCTPISARGVYYDEGATVVRRPRLALEVNFAFGSAELTRDATDLLDELAEALQREEIEADRFLLVGHTDAVGSDANNLSLSRARAGAVYDYLTRVRGIDPARLQSRGCGESLLLDAANPESARNRRVEVINAGPT